MAKIDNIQKMLERELRPAERAKLGARLMSARITPARSEASRKNGAAGGRRKKLTETEQ